LANLAVYYNFTEAFATVTPSTLPFSHQSAIGGEGFKKQVARSPSPLDTLFVVWEKDLG
jgi:hypothetical protein